MDSDTNLEDFYAKLKNTKKVKKKAFGDSNKPLQAYYKKLEKKRFNIPYDTMIKEAYEEIEERDLKVKHIPLRLDPPKVVNKGSRKVKWINFGDTCKKLKRDQEHVKRYILNELTTTGQIDSKNAFIIKRKIHSSSIEQLIRIYKTTYITCSSCNSAETELDKDKGSHLTTLKCKECGSSSTVSQTTSGHIAQVGRRKKVDP